MSELPHQWAKGKLEDVADWGSGGTPSRKTSAYFDGVIPWVKTGELRSKYIRSTEEHISEEALKNSAAKLYPKGAICIAMYGATIGKASIFGIDAATNQACAVGVPLSGLTSSEFLYYFFLSEKRSFIKAGIGGAQPNISQGLIRSWPIPLPPLNEQKRIVAKIEELFSELDAGEQSLRQARQQLGLYRQSLLKQAFEGKLTAQWRQQNPDKLESPDKGRTIDSSLPESWRSLTLAESFKMYQPKTIATKLMKENGAYPVFGANGIIGAYDQYNHEEPQVLVTCRGATCGAVNVSKPFSWINGNAMVIQPFNHPVDQKFLTYLFLGGIRIEKAISGSAQPQITRKSLEPLIFPLCSLPEQQEIVRLLDEQFEVIAQNEQEIDAALKRSEALRQSILKKAFTGQLVPQNPTDEPATTLLARIRTEREAAAKLAKPKKKAAKNR